MSQQLVIDMSDKKDKARLHDVLRQLSGLHRIDIKQYRARRSDRQNRYYWPVFVHEFAEFMRGQGQYITDDDAHEILKHRFLRRTVVNPETGERMEYTPSTTSLDTAEFNEYLDRIAHWLSDTFGIIVPDADEYHEKDETTPDPAKAEPEACCV